MDWRSFFELYEKRKKEKCRMASSPSPTSQMEEKKLASESVTRSPGCWFGPQIFPSKKKKKSYNPHKILFHKKIMLDWTNLDLEM